jgi:SAM-dependent methyltransferase
MSQAQHSSSEALRQMDLINRRAWSHSSTVRSFRQREGWTDPGERAALESVRPDATDQPILDLGVGAGRTIPLVLPISRDYVGLDYTAELVRACRDKYPDVRVVHGDARDLSRFADESFQLVMFSFNGIDAVCPPDRVVILREIRRVLRPGGTLLFSTHNHDGPGHGEGLSFGVERTRNPVKLAARVALAMAHAAQTVRNYRRYSKLGHEGDGYSVRNAAAHHHGILVHYITLQGQLEQLEANGFRPHPLVWASSDGRRLLPEDDNSDAWWFHLVARK